MIASADFLTWLVLPALLITVASPILLLIFLIRDWKRRTLW